MSVHFTIPWAQGMESTPLLRGGYRVHALIPGYIFGYGYGTSKYILHTMIGNYGARARAGGTCLVAVLHAASVIGCWGRAAGAASVIVCW